MLSVTTGIIAAFAGVLWAGLALDLGRAANSGNL
jgi:hypothetical protein